MTKLNDTQRTILASAGARQSGLVLPLPKSLKLNLAKATPVIRRMLEGGLVLERAAIDGEAIWRADEESGKLTLVVTVEGLRAIGIEPEQTASPSAMVDKAPRRSPGKSPARPSKNASDTASTAASAAPTAPTPRPGSKLDILIAALRAKKGATIGDLANATGWQAHSVRGAISGALKKKQGLNVVSTVIDGRGRVYRVEA